nr:hypothetical protein [Tanacetum cinerariifolium]
MVARRVVLLAPTPYLSGAATLGFWLQPWRVLSSNVCLYNDAKSGRNTLTNLPVGEIGPYLGEAARRRACSHGGLHTFFPRPALANLSPTLKAGRLGADFRDAYGFTVRPP